MRLLIETVGQVQILAAFVGLLVLLLWESRRPFFNLFQQSQRQRGLHLVRNLALGGLNALLVAAVFVGLWVAATAWAEDRGVGLLNWMTLPGWAHALGAVLLFDAWTYLWHRINHRVTFLWRFHRVHHADAQMDVTTASRFHVGEILFSSVLRIPLIVLFGVYAWELLLYETLMFAVVQFHHANIALPPRLDRVLRWFIVTPGMHKVHHSRWQPETDSNYSSLLSCWDRLGRSFRTRERLEDLHFGLEEFDREEDATIKGLLRMPLVEVEKSTIADAEEKEKSSYGTVS